MYAHFSGKLDRQIHSTMVTRWNSESESVASIGMYIDHFLVGEFVTPSPPQESPLPPKSPPHSGGDPSVFLSKKVPLTVG